jgi:hypothetical protein
MGKFKFNPEVSLGHIITLAGFLLSAVTFGVQIKAEQEHLRRDINRLSDNSTEIGKILNATVQAQNVLAQRLDDHLYYENQTPRNPRSNVSAP